MGKVTVNSHDVRQAVQIFTSFRERKPKRLSVVDVDIPSVVVMIGHIDALDYTTEHGKKKVLYRHEFAKGSRPLFCVSADGEQLLLIGGRFQFDERGIVDKSATGADIIPPEHGEPI